MSGKCRGAAPRLRYGNQERRADVNNGKKGTDKKKGTLRPWLVDVVVDHLR
jgi:hypothetical protein